MASRDATGLSFQEFLDGRKGLTNFLSNLLPRVSLREELERLFFPRGGLGVLPLGEKASMDTQFFRDLALTVAIGRKLAGLELHSLILVAFFYR